MRIMSLDYGTKRTGVAVCDELGITVRPVETIRGQNRTAAVRRTAQLAEELEAALVVIGLPLNMDGSEGPIAQRVREFATALAARINIPVQLQDERLTSHEADQLLRERGYNQAERKARSDQWAAMILLEDYLASQQHRGTGHEAAIQEDYEND